MFWNKGTLFEGSGLLYLIFSPFQDFSSLPKEKKAELTVYFCQV